jgi:Uma2 family endonuclease
LKKDERFIAAYPAGQQPLPFEEIDGVLPVPDFCQGLQLTVGDIFGWLKVIS